jgi:hypothetical protein
MEEQLNAQMLYSMNTIMHLRPRWIMMLKPSYIAIKIKSKSQLTITIVRMILFVCFILVLRPPPRRGMWTTEDKRNRPPPLRASHNKRNPPLPACAVRKSRGMGPPYKGKKQNKTKKSRWWLWWQLQARVPPCLLLLRLPHYPLIHSFCVSLV